MEFSIGQPARGREENRRLSGFGCIVDCAIFGNNLAGIYRQGNDIRRLKRDGSASSTGGSLAEILGYSSNGIVVGRSDYTDIAFHIFDKEYIVGIQKIA